MRAKRQTLLTILALGSFLTAADAGAVPCATTDVSLTIGGTLYTAATCADDASTDGGARVKTDSINAALGTSGFRYLDKSSDDLATGKKGVSFQVLDSGGNNGTWSLTWEELPGKPNLPLTIDLEIGLFGGGTGSAYLFEDVLLPADTNTAAGTYDINFTNRRGRDARLSNLIIAGDMATAATARAVPVPEPSSLALLSGALFGIGWFARVPRRTATH